MLEIIMFLLYFQLLCQRWGSVPSDSVGYYDNGCGIIMRSQSLPHTAENGHAHGYKAGLVT